MKARLLAVGLIVCAGFAHSGPANAQIWIGQIAGDIVAQAAESSCMSGAMGATPEGLAVHRANAQISMQSYLNLAGVAVGADTTAAFSRRRDRQVWFADGVQGNSAAVDDPTARALAAAGASLPEPDAFFRSGDGRTAAGHWTVRDPAAARQVDTYYRGVFRRERRNWVLVLLEVERTGKRFPPLTQYCHTIGDVFVTSVAIGPPPKPSEPASNQSAPAEPAPSAAPAPSAPN